MLQKIKKNLRAIFKNKWRLTTNYQGDSMGADLTML